MKIEWIQKDKHRMTPHPPPAAADLSHKGRGEQRQQQLLLRLAHNSRSA